jgi:hypothetical protein
MNGQMFDEEPINHRSELRHYFDKSEYLGGQTGSKPARAFHEVAGEKPTGRHEIPEWSKSDQLVRRVLLTAFPKLATNSRHRCGARRWMAVVYFYFRRRCTVGQAVEEINMLSWSKWATYSIVKHIIEDIRNVGKGLSANGRVRRSRGGYRPGSGRPRSKSSAVMTN